MARAGKSKQESDYRRIRGSGKFMDVLLFRVFERCTWPTDEEMRVLRSKRHLFIYYYLADLAVKEATHRRTSAL